MMLNAEALQLRRKLIDARVARRSVQGEAIILAYELINLVW